MVRWFDILSLRSRLAITLDNPFVGSNLFQGHWTAWTKFLGTDTYFGTKAELGTIRERCGGIPIDTGGIDMSLETTGILFVLSNDGLAMTTAKLVDMSHGLVQ